MAIPPVDLVGQYDDLRDELDAALLGVARSGQFIGGPAVRAFEEACEAYLGVPHAIGCASGTDALQLALMALGIGPGDEVITTPFTFVATAETIALLGARPVYVDIDPITFNIDPARIEAAITPRTRAVVPVHLFGQPADMDEILEIAARRRIAVIEDAAQAFGAMYRGRRVCSLAPLATVSFYPTKNLSAFGDAGLVTATDDALAASIRMIANHGQSGAYRYERIGVNSRLDAIQAAVLAVKLRHLDAWNAQRARVAEWYREELAGSAALLPSVAPHRTHIYHQFTLRVPKRDAVLAALRSGGIAAGVYYPIPLHLHPAYATDGGRAGDFPVAEQAAGEVLSVPIHERLTREQVHTVASALRAALAG